MVIAKAWAGVFGALVTALTAALSDDVFDINDTTQIIVTMVPVLGTMWAVYATRNRPSTEV